MKPKYEVGDWVCFMKNGILKIGKIEYVKERRTAQKQEYITTEGGVSEDSVLECRRITLKEMQW